MTRTHIHITCVSAHREFCVNYHPSLCSDIDQQNTRQEDERWRRLILLSLNIPQCFGVLNWIACLFQRKIEVPHLLKITEINNKILKTKNIIHRKSYFCLQLHTKNINWMKVNSIAQTVYVYVWFAREISRWFKDIFSSSSFSCCSRSQLWILIMVMVILQ